MLKVWAPQAGAQTRLITCPCNEILYGGAKGAGKSDGIIGKWLAHAGRNPIYARGVVFRKSMPELEQLIARSKEILTRLGWRYFETARTWRSPTGATLKFRQIKNAKEATKYQGHEYTFIAFDEVGDIKEPEVVDILRGALRSSKPITDRVLLLTGNPMGPGHKWLFRRFIAGRKAEIPVVESMRIASGATIAWSTVFIPGRLEDNPALMEQDPGYELRLKQMTRGKPWLYKALRFGDWNVKAEVPGALLTQKQIEDARVMMTPSLARVLIGVDPTVKGYDEEKSAEELELELGDECGIVSLGRDEAGKRYVLRDSTMKADPTVWAREVVRVFYADKADCVVAESNNGGELIRILIKAVDKNVPVELVDAKRGKYVRAEPCAFAVKDKELYFLGEHPELEEEWTTWKPDGKHASPNRIDAMVWAYIKDAVENLDTGVLDFYKNQASLLPPELRARMEEQARRLRDLMKGKKK